MRWLTVTSLACLGLATAQQVGTLNYEIHPRLQWSRCTAKGGACEAVNGEITLDANLRWLHNVGGFRNCFDGNTWNKDTCSSTQNCTDTCALEGASYDRTYGIKTANDSISLKLKTYLDFATNVGSRLFLLESKNKYQMFTLLNNELAFDVDLSTVECGINSALYFVSMDPDGGQAKYPTNKAGAEYGTGYCDASCPRNIKFIKGRANMEGWMPSETDPDSGSGPLGACCPQFSVWNSNSHSFSMSSHTCPNDGLSTCEGWDCENYHPEERGRKTCERWGCSYNPFRMGHEGFYGKGKTVDTTKNFTVVTRWDENQVSQFFIQDGKKIDIPSPVWDGLQSGKASGGLSADMCANQPSVFNERSAFAENGGWDTHKRQILNTPMALTMSIGVDYYAWNTWLDSVYPPYDSVGHPGEKRGDCLPVEDNEPYQVHQRYSKAKVVWSNIRFGPIGTTVKV